jgi:hypothetical protein
MPNYKRTVHHRVDGNKTLKNLASDPYPMKQKSIPDPQLCLKAAKTDLRENAERISEKYEDIKVNAFSIVNRSLSLPNPNNVKNTCNLVR